ncbi:virulence factor BrkB family protein [Pseudomonas stutzeri]|nr:virulence factor BrkB family protein [Stutzerimonas stutzeri]
MHPHLQRARDFAEHLLRRFFADRIPQSAAALTYTTLFAVVPMMTVTFVMLAAVPAFRDLGEPIQRFIFDSFVPSAGEQVQQHLSAFSGQARELTWIGVGVLVVTALLTLKTIESAFNQIWRVRRARRGLSSFLLYWAILSLGPLLLGAGFAASTYVTSLKFLSGPEALPGAATLLGLTPLFTGIAAFTLLYAAVPNTRVRLRHALIGGSCAALLFEAAKALFALYVTLFPGYQLIYGAFAAVPLFLVWIYLSWLIVLAGAELVCHLGAPDGWRGGARAPLLNLLGVLAQFHACQQRGGALSREGLARLGWGMDDGDWAELIDFLEGERLVSATGNGDWVLCRDLSGLSLHQLLERSPWPLPASARLPERLPEGLAATWYPPLRAALLELERVRGERLGGSLAQWLGGSAGES